MVHSMLGSGGDAESSCGGLGPSHYCSFSVDPNENENISFPPPPPAHPSEGCSFIRFLHSLPLWPPECRLLVFFSQPGSAPSDVPTACFSLMPNFQNGADMGGSTVCSEDLIWALWCLIAGIVGNWTRLLLIWLCCVHVNQLMSRVVFVACFFLVFLDLILTFVVPVFDVFTR